MVSPLMEVSFTFVQKGLTNTDMAFVLNFGEAQGYLYKDGFYIFLKNSLSNIGWTHQAVLSEKDFFPPVFFHQTNYCYIA